jgi:Prolyl-tRNA synthetase
VILDDRDERSGVKFKDADLIGYPVRLVVGRGLAERNVEVTLRRDKVTQDVPVDDAVDRVNALLDSERRRAANRGAI